MGLSPFSSEDAALAARVALAVVAAGTLVTLFWFALRLDDRRRSAVLWSLLPVLGALPFVVPASHRLWRAIAAIACSTPWLKLYDLHYGRTQGAAAPGFRDYLVFHLNPCALVERRLVDAPHPPTGDSVRRLLRGAMDVMLGGVALRWVFRACRHGAWPFAAEHSAKAVLTFVIVFGAFEILTALWRLAGLRAPTVMLRFFLARTPAEFWRLYNRQVSQFFAEDVVVPLYPVMGPAAATIAAFFLSGVVHEYLAFMAIGRVHFFLTGFFVLQGVGVIATYRLRPKGGAAIVGVVATLAFQIATSLLYFASVNDFLPWYSAAALHWMP